MILLLVFTLRRVDSDTIIIFCELLQFTSYWHLSFIISFCSIYCVLHITIKLFFVKNNISKPVFWPVQRLACQGKVDTDPVVYSLCMMVSMPLVHQDEIFYYRCSWYQEVKILLLSVQLNQKRKFFNYKEEFVSGLLHFTD